MKETFFAAFFSLVKLSFSIKDKFFRQKLIQKTKEFFDFFLERGLVVDVAQCRSDKLKESIAGISELVEIIVYLKATPPSPALLVQKNLLRLRLQLLDSAPTETPPLQGPTLHVDNSSHQNVLNSKYKNLEAEIMRILKNKPDGLFLREIISSLSPQCSRRTLQRHLNRLIATGGIFKRGTNNSAKYFRVLQGPTLHVDN